MADPAHLAELQGGKRAAVLDGATGHPGAGPTQAVLRLALTLTPSDLHTVPDIQGCRHLIRAPATPPQLSRTQTQAKPRMTGTCRCPTQEGRSMGSDGAADPGLGRGGSWGCLELPARPPTPNTSEIS